MPHDKHGQLLTAGDHVIIRATVKSTDTTEEWSNVMLQTDEKMFPGDKPTSLTLNSKQVELVKAPEPAPVAAAPVVAAEPVKVPEPAPPVAPPAKAAAPVPPAAAGKAAEKPKAAPHKSA